MSPGSSIGLVVICVGIMRPLYNIAGSGQDPLLLSCIQVLIENNHLIILISFLLYDSIPPAPTRRDVQYSSGVSVSGFGSSSRSDQQSSRLDSCDHIMALTKPGKKLRSDSSLWSMCSSAICLQDEV